MKRLFYFLVISITWISSAEEIYENPFSGYNYNDFTDYTFNYLYEYDYGEGNVTKVKGTNTKVVPTFTPVGFKHWINRTFMSVSNQLTGQEGNYTLINDIINDQGTRGIMTDNYSLLGSWYNEFNYADGTPKTGYLKRNQIWDSFHSTNEIRFVAGKFWKIVGNHSTRATVMGLKPYGFKNLLEIKFETYSTYEFLDVRKTVGGNMDINLVPSYYLNATKKFEGSSLWSKNLGYVYQSGESFSLSKDILVVYGDDTEGVQGFSGEKEEDIRQQILSMFKPHKYSSRLESTLPSIDIHGFTPLNENSLNSINPQLDSWTWNGAFPWVYNGSTDSWFYYAFTGNTCNAYDARSGSWFTFNGVTGVWNQVD